MEWVGEIARTQALKSRGQQRAARDRRRVTWIDAATLELRRARLVAAQLPGGAGLLSDEIDAIIAELAQLRARIRTGATDP